MSDLTFTKGNKVSFSFLNNIPAKESFIIGHKFKSMMESVEKLFSSELIR